MRLMRNVLAIATAIIIGLVCPTVTAPAEAVTAFTVSGTRTLHDPPFPEQLLPDFFTDTAISRIDYPAAVFGMDRSIAIAQQSLGTGLLHSPEQVIAAGFSQGAIAVAYAKKDVMALPAEQRPVPDALTFVTIGDPAGDGGILKNLRFRVPLIGLTPFTPPDTPYDTVIVNGEYDGWADFPDRPWNLLSLANALLGIVYVHGGYETIPGGLDVSNIPAANITTRVNSLGGSTTTYLIPTEKLPLVQPLRDLGVSERIVTAIEKPLKKIVDKGYKRNDAAVPSAVPPKPTATHQAQQPQRRAASESHRRSSARL